MPVSRRLWDSCVVVGYLAGYEDLKPDCPQIISLAEQGGLQIVVSAMATGRLLTLKATPTTILNSGYESSSAVTISSLLGLMFL